MASEVKWQSNKSRETAVARLDGNDLWIMHTTEGWTCIFPLLGQVDLEALSFSAAKAEALRLVREAVKRLADAVGEGTNGR